jgi:CHAT domain-containing protein
MALACLAIVTSGFAQTAVSPPPSVAANHQLSAKTQAKLINLQNGLNSAQAANDHRAEAKAFNLIGEFYYHASDFQTAFDKYNQALTAARLAKDEEQIADALNGIGDCYLEQADSKQASDLYQQALELAAPADDANGEATALIGLGWASNMIGENQKALEFYDRALPLAQKARNRNVEARALRRTGLVYYVLGDKQKALEFYNKALPVFHHIGDRDREATVLNDIGLVYLDMGENDKALSYHKKALPIFRHINDRDGEGLTLSHIGRAYGALGKSQKELEYHLKALPIISEVGDPDAEATMRNDIGRVYSLLGEEQKALDYYNQALPQATAVNDPLLEAVIFYNLMCNQRASRPTLAIFYGKQAVKLLQQVRGHIQSLDSELQQKFLASKQDYYHDLADLLIAQNRLPEAQQVLDMMKEAQFAEFTRSRKAKDPSDQTVSLNAAEQAAEKEYQDASQNLFQIAEAESVLEKKLNRSDDDNNKLAGLNAQLTDANRMFHKLLDQLPTILPNMQGQKAEDMSRKIVGLRLLMHNIAEPGTVALYTMVTDHYYRVIVIGSDAQMSEHHTEIPIGQLRGQVARFKELLSLKPGESATDKAGHRQRAPAETAELMELSARLYATLIAPITKALDFYHPRTLVWELDDALHYIPLGALYDPTAKQYLVEKYASVIITPGDPSILHARPDIGGARILAMGISNSGYDTDFDALPNVPLELDSIVRDPSKPDTKGVLPGTEWLDSDFTEARLIQELKGPENAPDKSHTYKIVHIASHFNADPAGDNIKSFLLLAGQNTALDQKGQGFHLTLDELRSQNNLQLIFAGVDLLTLSACQTAVTVQTGEGHEIDGLGGVAQEQGAEAVLASLWSVYDESTSKLMTRFYKLWTDPMKMPAKVDALRHAQLDMLGVTYTANGQFRVASDPAVAPTDNYTGEIAVSSFADPYYWAPFILMGNWK